MRVGAYPGSFDPPTTAHVAIAEAAWRQGGLDRVHLVLSRSPLGKKPTAATFELRLARLEKVAAGRPWLESRVSDHQLISDVVQGYQAVVMGADKWAQVTDPAWYGGSTHARDAAVAALPKVLLARRAGLSLDGPLPPGCIVLEIDERHAPVSSTLARAGRTDWIAPEALGLDHDPPHSRD